MKKSKLDKKTLDAVGRKLFETNSLSADAIDNIVASPELFSLVTRRIAEEQVSQPARPVLVSSFVKNLTLISAAAVLVIAVVVAAVFQNLENDVRVTQEIQIPVAVPETARPEVPPQPFVGKLSAGRASYRKKSGDRSNDRSVKNHGPNPEIVGTLPEREFYSIALPGQITDMTDGGHQIIRVEMSRSSLFALGVDIPLENGPEKVTADLLIGADGSTRAIRVVD